ncbi:TRAP transporter small permease [Pikeienuella sp. HZG-20]|uniref:TRAP transporter small permease n=1 Tax=Paludibacillus litoralis TaxID=3133267 RepID=UPI0030EF9952
MTGPTQIGRPTDGRLLPPGGAQPPGGWFLRAVGAVSTLAGWFSAAMLVAAVAVTCQMIFVRFVLNESTIWQTELVVYLVIAATLIGLPYVQHLRGHVNVDLVPIAMKSRPRFVLAVVTLAATIVITFLMLWYGVDYWLYVWDRGWRSGTVWDVELWLPYLAMPIGFGLLLLQLAADFVALVTGAEKPFGLEGEN